MEIRKYNESDVPAMVRIWNEVVEEGVAFPQEEFLDERSGRAFFAAQSYCGVAVADGRVVGLYILHPNNIAGAATSRMPAMPWIPRAGASISAKSWYPTVLRRP